MSRRDNNANYFASMTDMMIGILFVLIIMIAYFAHQNSRQNPIPIYISLGEEKRKGIAQEVAKGLREKNVDAVVSPRNPGVVTLRGANLFVPGESSLTPQALSVISYLAEVVQEKTSCYVLGVQTLQEMLKCNPDRVFLEAVFVEGHTDNKPVTTTLRDGSKNNLELSARRATNTHDAMAAAAPLLTTFKNLDSEPVLSVAAYGEQRPVAPNATEDGRAKNRRIDIRFVMWVPKSTESLENQLGSLGRHLSKKRDERQ